MGGRKQKFKPVKAGVYVIGEGITEQYYFTHVKHFYKYRCAVRPRLFCNTSISDIEDRIKELLRGDIIIICVFDADISNRNKKENERLQTLQHKYRKNENVIFCDSLPSIEYWFLIHFKDTCPNFKTAKQAEQSLVKYIPAYKKTEKFLENEKWVNDMSKITCSVIKANERAIKYGTDKASYSNVYKAINKLHETID